MKINDHTVPVRPIPIEHLDEHEHEVQYQKQKDVPGIRIFQYLLEGGLQKGVDPSPD